MCLFYYPAIFAELPSALTGRIPHDNEVRAAVTGFSSAASAKGLKQLWHSRGTWS